MEASSGYGPFVAIVFLGLLVGDGSGHLRIQEGLRQRPCHDMMEFTWKSTEEIDGMI